ncbi:MAG: phospholipase D-like domain-containing protein [Gammaproteobacteria bacterium]
MQHWQTVIALLVTFTSLAAAVHALLNKREPRAALGWCALSLLVPLVGPLLYVVFGINRVQAVARRLRLHEKRTPGQGGYPPPPAGTPEWLHPLVRLSGSLQHWPMTAGNKVVELHNGNQAYPEMIAAVESARERIYLSSYIFDTNKSGMMFVDALAAAVQRGLDVKVLVDGIGELYSWPRIGRVLRKHGIPVRRFAPPSVLPPSIRINLRNHRKILVADNQIAFAGGMNIGDRHVVASEDSTRGKKRHDVVDIHFRFEGDIARQLQQVFLEDWAKTEGSVAPPMPDVETASAASQTGALCRVLTDGPGEDMDKLIAVLTGAVSAARDRVLVMTPYFLPPRELTGAMVAASLRGVEVTIILPEKNNLPVVHWATQRMLWEVLRWGVRVYYQPGTFAHSKILIIDNDYVQIGSANLDPRSLRLNFELAVEIIDQKLVSRLAKHCLSVKARSKEITSADLDRLPLPVRLRNSLAWLFSPYL